MDKQIEQGAMIELGSEKINYKELSPEGLNDLFRKVIGGAKEVTRQKFVYGDGPNFTPNPAKSSSITVNNFSYGLNVDRSAGVGKEKISLSLTSDEASWNFSSREWAGVQENENMKAVVIYSPFPKSMLDQTVVRRFLVPKSES